MGPIEIRRKTVRLLYSEPSTIMGATPSHRKKRTPVNTEVPLATMSPPTPLLTPEADIYDEYVWKVFYNYCPDRYSVTIPTGVRDPRGYMGYYAKRKKVSSAGEEKV